MNTMPSNVSCAEGARYNAVTPYKDIVVISLVALLVHLVFIWLLPEHWKQNQSADYFSFYEPVARNILAGNGLVLPNGTPAVTYPPAYPLLLAGCFQTAQIFNIAEPTALRILSATMVMLTTALVYLVGLRMFSWRIARIASLLWATYPLFLWQSKQPDTTLPFTALILLAVYFTDRWLSERSCSWKSGLTVGVLLALACLIRPITLFLPIVTAAMVWMYAGDRHRLSRATFCACLILGNVGTLLPWEIWARQRAGIWIPVSTNGPASIADGLTFSTNRAHQTAQQLPLPADVQVLVHEASQRMRDLQSTSAIGSFLAQQVITRPVTFLKFIGLKAGRAWYGTDSHRLEDRILLLQIPFLALAAWGLLIAWKSGMQERRRAALVLGVTLYFWAMTVIALSIVRYMLPVISLLMIFVALALDRIFRPPSRESASYVSAREFDPAADASSGPSSDRAHV